MSNDVDDLGRREGCERPLAGGNWIFSGAWCRSADRDRIWPRHRSQYFGFRLVLREIGRVRDHDERKERE